MSIKIDKKIVDYIVNTGRRDVSTHVTDSPGDNVIQMHEKLERPEMLLGSTYKVKTPLSEHAIYVTINDVVFNPGTEQEQSPAFRGIHQLQEHGELPVDRGA